MAVLSLGPTSYCKFNVILTLRVYKMEPNGPVRVRLVPFVHSQSYRPIKVHLVPNYHLAGYPLELCQVPLGVPGPHFGNHCCIVFQVQMSSD